MGNLKSILLYLVIVLFLGGVVGCALWTEERHWAADTDGYTPWWKELPQGYSPYETAGKDTNTGLWKEITHEKTGVVMVLVPAGKYQTYRDKHTTTYKKEDENRYWVEIKQPYYIGKYEVTNKQYCVFLNEEGNKEEWGSKWVVYNEDWCGIRYDNGRYYPAKGWEDRPVVGVTWHGARAFSKWLGADLPTEARWEYACRTGGSYWFWYQKKGESYEQAYKKLGDYAWYAANSSGASHKIGTKRPNSWNLYDMRGNVWEWCLNYWHEDYETPDHTLYDSTYDDERDWRLFMAAGGSWSNTMWTPRGANRAWTLPDWRDAHYGFRVCEPYGWTED